MGQEFANLWGSSWRLAKEEYQIHEYAKYKKKNRYQGNLGYIKIH